MMGFSLLEMLLVLMLIGLMATMTAVSMRRGLAGARIQAAAGQLAAALRDSRLQAVAGGRSVDFMLDLDRRRYGIGSRTTTGLPAGLSLSMRYAVVTTRGLPGHQGRIRFFPDGSSSGGLIVLRQGRRQWQVDVSWLTGTVATRALRQEH